MILSPGDPRATAQPPALNGAITSLWWTLDGKSVCANDAAGIETLYDGVTGKQTDADFRAFRP